MSRPSENSVVYVCRDYYVRYSAGRYLVNFRNCYIASARTLRLAKKRIKR